MEEMEVGSQTEQMPARHAVPRMRVLDASASTEGVLDRALAFCAEKLSLDGPEAALELLRRGDAMARWYGHHHLAEEVAEIIGELDPTVQSVFVFDLDATPEDRAFAEPRATEPIHMIVRVQRKTEALQSLLRALEDAVLADYARRVGPEQLHYLLDVQVIDARDVEKRRGYAALLSSLYNQPIQVWKRDEQHSDSPAQQQQPTHRRGSPRDRRE